MYLRIYSSESVPVLGRVHVCSKGVIPAPPTPSQMYPTICIHMYKCKLKHVTVCVSAHRQFCDNVWECVMPFIRDLYRSWLKQTVHTIYLF